MKELAPRLVKRGEYAHLEVDGRPYLVLSVQWDCCSCYTPAGMDPYFEHAVKMGCNTATLPLYWGEVEPEPGRYDWRMLDHRLAKAREHGLRLVLMWYGTYKNAEIGYAPADVVADVKTYRRVRTREGAELPEVICPLSVPTRDRDVAAFTEVMTRLREADQGTYTTVMMQVENEPGILGSDRCYCTECDTAFAESQAELEEAHGPRAAEAFSAQCVANYLEAVAAAGRTAYDLPMFMNVWLGGEPGERPGWAYPSGGAVPSMLELYRKTLQTIDFIAPDLYDGAYRSFAHWAAQYRASGWPLYIAETGTDEQSRTAKNAFYAIGRDGAIGFDPWSMSHPYFDEYAPPLVSTRGQWSPLAHELARSYWLLRDVEAPLARALGTPHVVAAVQEEGERLARFAFERYDAVVSFSDPSGQARALIIERAPGEFIIAGHAVAVRFMTPAPEAQIVPIGTEVGRFDGDTWVSHGPQIRHTALEQDPVVISDASVWRVTIQR